MIIKKLLPILLLFGSAPARPADSGGGDLVIITNSATPANAISPSEARLIFTKDIRSWKNGARINVVTMKRTNEMHTRFSQEVLNLYPYQIERSIERKRYTGTAQSEIIANSQDEMLRIVAETPGAIGYANKAVVVDKTVKILEVIYE